MSTDINKNSNQYIGDIVGSLIKEAASWQARCSMLENELMKLQKEFEQFQINIKNKD